MSKGEQGLLISGVGGQGIVFAGRLLARAWFSQGKHVALRHAYGAEVMGTAVHSELVVSESPILCPYLETADVAVVLHRAAVDEVLPRLAGGALLVLDAEVGPVSVPDGVQVEVRPFLSWVEEAQPGDAGRASPLLALGFLSRRGVVDLDPLLAAIGVDAGFADNRELIFRGHSLG